MSVSVKELTKIYGSQRAVDAISFDVDKGQILGFLGPNGAGKSTTMKIITSYLKASSGEAIVAGYNVQEAPMEVRRRVGYLPEHNPLYLDMYVKEYLTFVARLHQLANRKKVVADMIEKVGLQVEQNKPIGALSKGYRQRVGLAQALIHDPEVLILDEPTSGLDPNQLVDIRHLIKSLGQEKTVILSTHIMQEVQAMCDRVAIINEGKLVANDPIENLAARIAGENRLTIAFNGAINEAVLKNVPGLKQFDTIGKNRYQLSSKKNVDIRETVFQLAVDNQWVILEMKQEVLSVEDVFHLLTQNEVADV